MEIVTHSMNEKFKKTPMHSHWWPVKVEKSITPSQGTPGFSFTPRKVYTLWYVTTPKIVTGLTKNVTGLTTAESTRTRATRYVWALTRLCLGWTFLWPFLDKTFGLGHETTAAHAWIHGGSPSLGFLSGATGPFAGFYQSIAGAGWVNWLFMIGLLGVGMRIAAVAGSVLLVLMWSASSPPQDDIFMDNHLIYALVLIGLALVAAGNTFGLGRWWTQTSLVRRFPWLT